MKRNALYFIMTVLFFIAFELVGRLALNRIINNIPDNSSHLSKVSKSLSVDNVDFVVVGMSTAEHNYNIAILEDSLQLQGYDCGSDGRNVYYDYIAVKNAIKNNKNLKLVIADIGWNGLTNATKDRISIVYPFYWKNSIVRKVTKELKGDRMDILMLSSMYQMNSGLQNLWRLFHPLASLEYKGFSSYPYTGKNVNLKNTESKLGEFHVDETVLEYLSKIIDECKTNNISVVFVTSPILVNVEDATKYLTSFVNNKDVVYLDYSCCEQIINDTKLFKDYSHLNEKGAEIFSESLSFDIKKIIGD